MPVPPQVRDFLAFEQHLKGTFAIAEQLTGRHMDIPAVWYQQPIYQQGQPVLDGGTDADASPGTELPAACTIRTDAADRQPCRVALVTAAHPYQRPGAFVLRRTGPGGNGQRCDVASRVVHGERAGSASHADPAPPCAMIGRESRSTGRPHTSWPRSSPAPAADPESVPLWTAQSPPRGQSVWRRASTDYKASSVNRVALPTVVRD